MYTLLLVTSITMSEQEALLLIKEAEKAVAYKSFFGGNKTEEAGELYYKAGNQFKLLKKWKESGYLISRT